ncbi:MAG: cell division protein SepF [Candidatus Hydrothermarchaeota archaeon]|nr:cell division protein SepF [Candidatus Hydrothermarchaeota archaeon]
MGIREFFSRLRGGQEQKSEVKDYVELPVQAESSPTLAPERYVKVCKLKGFSDVDITASELGEGNIVILDIKPLADRSTTELRHAVDEIKDICTSMGGDIAGLSEYHLIMTPPSVKIERSTESKAGTFEDAMERVRKRMSK